MIARALWTSMLLLASPSGMAAASLPPSVVTAADAYRSELDEVEHAAKRVPMEQLVARAFDLARTVDQTRSKGELNLDSLPANEFADLQTRLRGLDLERGGRIGVSLDAAFFEKLGERKGRTEDRLFLRLFHRTYPNGQWPAYVRPANDEGGCTDFGSGKLVSLFSEWTRYGALHKGQYTEVVRAQIEAIRSALTQDTCACGSAGSVQSELRFFTRRYASDPAAAAVRKRLDEVRRGESNFRFHCGAG